MGLALDEPKADDEKHETDGMTFLIPAEIQRWMSSGVDLHVDYNQYWGSFSVRLGGHYGSC
jgi:uncharacterized protein YneR